MKKTGNMKKAIYISIALLLFVVGNLSAQTFSASVNKANVQVGETFQISFTVEDGNMSNFQPPKFDNFNLMGGPNQSTNMQYINGSMSRSVSYSYYLQAKKEGTFTIGSAQAKISGNTMKTNSVNVTVGKSANGGSGGQSKTIDQQIKENVFIRVIISDDEVYQGEQLTVTYKLYQNANIHNITISKLPSFNGFWSQEIELPQNNQFQPEVYKGKRYSSVVVKKYVLFPQTFGEMDIDPMNIEAYARIQVQSNRRGFFDDFFGSYKDIPFEIESPTLKINVKPLPEGKPSSFSGLTGKFDMDVSLDKTSTETDDPITMKVKISGKGNLKMLEAPRPDLPRDFEVFDPKIKERSSKSSNTVSGYKQYDYLLIPRRPGTFKIPPMKFSYFDTEQEKYVELSSKEYEVAVTGEASTVSSPQIGNISKEEVELLGEDIRHIKSDTVLEETGAYYIKSFSFFLLALMPLALFILLIFFKRKNDELSSNTGLMKRKRASKEAAKRLSKAKKLLSAESDAREFYKAVSEALWGYVGDRLNIPVSDLTRDKAENELSKAGVKPDLRKEFFAVLDKCEMALFAPSSKEDKNTMYDLASSVIDKIGGTLK